MSGERLIQAKIPPWDILLHVEEWGGVMYIKTLYGVYTVSADGELELMDIITGAQVAN